MKIDIIKAKESDMLDLSIMTGELLQEIMDKIGSEVFTFNQEETQQRANDLISNNLYFIFFAKYQNKPVGFISLCESHALYAEGSYGIIPELYIREEYRSLNIGKLLLDEAKKFAYFKKWKNLVVTTPPLPQFDRTSLFYENNGFDVTGGKKLKIDIG